MLYMKNIIDQILDSKFFADVVNKSSKETVATLFKLSENEIINAFAIYYVCMNISEDMPEEIKESFEKLYHCNYCLKFCYEKGLISEKERFEKGQILTKIICENQRKFSCQTAKEKK